MVDKVLWPCPAPTHQGRVRSPCSSVANTGMQCFDQGARRGSEAGAAVAHHPGQSRFDAVQTGYLDANIHELAFAQFARLVAVHAVVELQQAGDLVEAEAQALGGFDELQAGDVIGSVAAEAALRSLGLAQQALALVEPDGFDIDPCRPGDGADGEVIRIMVHGLSLKAQCASLTQTAIWCRETAVMRNERSDRFGSGRCPLDDRISVVAEHPSADTSLPRMHTCRCTASLLSDGQSRHPGVVTVEQIDPEQNQRDAASSLKQASVGVQAPEVLEPPQRPRTHGHRNRPAEGEGQQQTHPQPW